MAEKKRKKKVVTHRQHKVIQALLEAPNLAKAGKMCGVSTATIWRYMQDPEFLAEYKEAQRALVRSLVDRLQSYSHRALTVLMDDVIENPNAKEHNRTAACRTVIEMSIRAIEIHKAIELEERITKLEQAGNSNHLQVM